MMMVMVVLMHILHTWIIYSQPRLAIFLLLDGDGHTSLSLFICSGIVTVMSSHVVMYSVSGARSMSDDEVATWADLEDDWICRGVSGVIERK